ncbi:hypothetical protein HPB47_025660, partial [Ixodes persulcatus]
ALHRALSLKATQFSLEDLVGPPQAPNVTMGKPCAPANTGSTHASFAPQAKLPAERPARSSGSSLRDEDRGHHSNSLDAAHQPKEQYDP